MASDKLNPSNFWGVTTRGFAFGNTTLLDPEEDQPKLGVVDSGTTLVLMPTYIYMNVIHELALKFKDDLSVDFVCTRTKQTGLLDHCYFNNTNCDSVLKTHGHKIGNMKFLLGDHVFELTPET